MHALHKPQPFDLQQIHSGKRLMANASPQQTSHARIMPRRNTTHKGRFAQSDRWCISPFPRELVR